MCASTSKSVIQAVLIVWLNIKSPQLIIQLVIDTRKVNKFHLVASIRSPGRHDEANQIIFESFSINVWKQ